MAGAGQPSADKPSVTLLAVAGLTLLISPLTTIAHELGGHAAACLGLHGKPTELGAYYIECPMPDASARRLVAMAGTGMDLLLFGVFFLLWRAARGDGLKLALWYTFMAKGMTAFGYWCFSGVSGIGDWGPGADGGIGPLPNEYLFRAALLVFGLPGYIGMIMLGRRTLVSMIGGGPDAFAAQRRIAIGFYIVNGVLAVVVGLFNPHGFFITLASAAASTLGGCAGMFNVGYSRTKPPARAFRVGGSIPLLLAGVFVAGAFAAVLGPTLKI
jgi:hypothetical protein